MIPNNVGEVYTHVSWKCHEDSVVLKYVRKYCKYIAIGTTSIDIHSDSALESARENNIYFPWKIHED